MLEELDEEFGVSDIVEDVVGNIKKEVKILFFICILYICTCQRKWALFNFDILFV